MANVFLSYQSQHKKTVEKLRDELKSRGFKTLFDGDDKKAVGKAAVVIMCMSASYKACTNCKKEIDQAKRLKKPIIRILVEAGFKPSGWLAVPGSKTIIDFSDPKKFKEKFEELLEELAAKKIKPKAVGKKKRRKKDDKDDDDNEEEDDGEDGDDNDGGEDKEGEDGGDGDNDEGGDDNEDGGCCGGGDDNEGGEGDDEDGCGPCWLCCCIYRCLFDDEDG